MLRLKIQSDMIQAMKQKDSLTLETIRYIWSEINNVEIDAKHELNDDEITSLLIREVKKRQDAIDLMRANNRPELADADTEKLKIIQTYLPKALSQAEIEAIVDQIITTGNLDFGSCMKAVMEKVRGKADGKLVSQIVKTKLQL